MEETLEKKSVYLKSIYKGLLPRTNPFIMHIGNGKEMFVISP